MKILHTSDIHLQEKNPNTLKTLESILKLAEKEQVDLITIGGDLFHSPENAEKLRTTVRRMCNDVDFPIIVIPGNHDEQVFRGNLDFGTNFLALAEQYSKSYSHKSFPEVNIVGVPFTSAISDELLLDLITKRKDGHINILILHCTLDITFSKDEFGEGETEYFEVSKATLRELRYDYILAGHFHTKYDKRELSPACTFVYPGSPISLNWKELGERAVAILNTADRTVQSVLLPETFYRDIIEINVSPKNEISILDEIEGLISEIKTKNAEFLIRINGYGRTEEIFFREKLERITDGVKIENNYIDVSRILDHPLYQRFQDELNNIDTTFDKGSLIEVVIQAMRDIIRRED